MITVEKCTGIPDIVSIPTLRPLWINWMSPGYSLWKVGRCLASYTINKLGKEYNFDLTLSHQIAKVVPVGLSWIPLQGLPHVPNHDHFSWGGRLKSQQPKKIKVELPSNRLIWFDSQGGENYLPPNQCNNFEALLIATAKWFQSLVHSLLDPCVSSSTISTKSGS